MPPYNETGHAKNVAHFEELKIVVTSFGSGYNPTKPALKLIQLGETFTKAQTALTKVTNTNTIFNNSTNARMLAFDILKPLSTRIINALEVSDADAEKIKDARALVRKIHGKRALSSKVQPVDPDTPAPVSISASQQSYDQLIQHLTNLVEIIKTEPSYAPNETDLQITALDAVLTQFKTLNTDVLSTHTNVTNERIARNKVLYTNPDSVIKIAALVKKYVKAAYNAASPEFEQVNAIPFKSYKK